MTPSERDPLQAARAILSAIYTGDPLNGTKPADCGLYAEYIEECIRTVNQGGDWEAVRRAVSVVPELASLADKIEGRDPWEVFTLADAYRPRPPVVYAVEGLFALPSLSIVYGAPGTMKSLLLGDLLTCVAAGLPWLPPLPSQRAAPIPTKQFPTLWLDFDNGRRTMHERFEALGRARNLPPDTPLYYVSMPSPWLDASDIVAMQDLADRVKRMGAKLVVIDNLGVVLGEADENSAVMATVMSNFRRLADDTESAVILIHHQRKSAGLKTREGDSLRGHSSIEAALDLALLVQRQPHEPVVTVRSTKTRNVDVYPFGACFTYEHKPGTVELGKARFFGVEMEDTLSDRAVDAAIIDVVGQNPGLSQTKLIDKVKESLPDVGKNRIRTRAEMLVSTGKLACQDKPGEPKQYRLVD